ncbi:MAG: hypothetical protein OXI86_14145 [Candidatus Poribacteria bacterium]|nr:hypothetical protein [Candidatus Poribacteria bacterium]
MSNGSATAQRIESILNEGELLTQFDIPSERNFMPSVMRSIRDLEHESSPENLANAVEHLCDASVKNPATAPLLEMILRHTPTRQSLYEAMLDDILVNWRSHLDDNPQTPLPEIFTEIGDKIRYKKMDYPDDLLEITKNMLECDIQQNRIVALRACEKLGTSELVEVCYEKFRNGRDDTRSRALLAASRLSDMNNDVQSEIINLFYDRNEDEFTRFCALEALLSPHSSEHLQALENPDSEFLSLIAENSYFIEALLDLALDSVAPTIENALHSRGLDGIPETLLRRIARSRTLSIDLRLPSANILQKNFKISPPTERSRFGTLVHRDSSWFNIGHVGVSIDKDGDCIIDCSTGRDPNAVSMVSFEKWKDRHRFYGFRVDHPRRADLYGVVRTAKKISSWRTEYDGNHFNQKGKWFKGWFCRPRYWESDCVGFAETCYEESGGNPTPDHKEKGLGWPLTPEEQRNFMRNIV